jgi:hypothetical protein
MTNLARSLRVAAYGGLIASLSAVLVVAQPATFLVTYHDFPADAQAAFQFAVDIWARHLMSPVPIRIDANWVPMADERELGHAQPIDPPRFNFPGAIPDTAYPDALADAMTGTDLGNGGVDIITSTNSNPLVNWYTGTDGNVGPD